MADFNFISPGYAATTALQKFLVDREAQQRQERLDKLMADKQAEDLRREDAQQKALEAYYKQQGDLQRRAQDLADQQRQDQLDELRRLHDEQNAARISTEAIPGDIADATIQDLMTRTGRSSQLQGEPMGLSSDLRAAIRIPGSTPQAERIAVPGSADTYTTPVINPAVVMRGGANYIARQEAEAARTAAAKEAADARLAAQQEREQWQAEQNDANRQNARTIAQMGADIRGAAAADKKAETDRLRKLAADSAFYATQETLDELNGTITDEQGNQQTTPGLLDAKGNLDPAVASIAGSNIGKATRYIPGSAAADAQARLDRLKDRLVTDLMAEMKAQSRTGATGFGALSEKELVLLQSAAARLTLNQSPESLREALLSIRNRVQRLHKNAADQRGGGTTPTPSAPSSSYKVTVEP